jgi:hypothetical protein
MKSILFSIKDDVTGIFNATFHAINNESAIRAFSQISVQNNAEISFSPEDYTLYSVGDFDDSTGVITPFDNPIPIINAKEVIELRRINDE